jgi:hypothetical protein
MVNILAEHDHAAKRVVRRIHCSNYPDPIGFEAGEEVLTGRRDDEYPGWIWVILRTGNQGWAPEQYLQVGSDTGEAIATRQYCARELDTRLGEVLIVHHELNEWVWVENSAGDFGWVPTDTTAPF